MTNVVKTNTLERMLMYQIPSYSSDPEQSKNPRTAKYKCVRVYLNGNMKRSYWDDGIEDWVEYNSVFRFGNALFVNGECVQRGYLTEESCKEYEKQFKAELSIC